jgi:hypothetical protein
LLAAAWLGRFTVVYAEIYWGLKTLVASSRLENPVVATGRPAESSRLWLRVTMVAADSQRVVCRKLRVIRRPPVRSWPRQDVSLIKALHDALVLETPDGRISLKGVTPTEIYQVRRAFEVNS